MAYCFHIRTAGFSMGMAGLALTSCSHLCGPFDVRQEHGPKLET